MNPDDGKTIVVITVLAVVALLGILAGHYKK